MEYVGETGENVVVTKLSDREVQQVAVSEITGKKFSRVDLGANLVAGETQIVTNGRFGGPRAREFRVRLSGDVVRPIPDRAQQPDNKTRTPPLLPCGTTASRIASFFMVCFVRCLQEVR